MTTAEPATPALPGVPRDAQDFSRDEIGHDARSWSRVLRVWHLGFYLLVAITAGALVADRPHLVAAGDPEMIATLVALALLVVAYAAFGWRAAHSGLDAGAITYLAVLFAVTTLVTGLNPLGTTLLFVAVSQVWLLAPSRSVGAWLCVLLTVLVTGGLLFRLRGTDANILAVTFQMALSLCFSLFLGLWLWSIIKQGIDRVQLLGDLRAAQDELGRTQHEAGVLAERERVAREIHDTLAQGFTSVVMLAQTASADLEGGRTGDVASRLALIESTARDNLAEARALVAASTPPPLREATLPQALTRLCDAFTAETGTAVTTTIDEAVLDPAAEVVLLRAAQEALSNVRRHARAGAASLSLRTLPDAVVFTVHDDGVGLDPTQNGGFGLRGMRERVAAYGGTMTVTSSAGTGTTVTVVLPAAPRPGDDTAWSDQRSEELA